MRWFLKLKLFLTALRRYQSGSKVAILLIVWGLMFYLNWSLGKVHEFIDLNCKTISCYDSEIQHPQDDFLSCAKNGDFITKTSVREIGNALPRKVFLTIGIPTIQRIYKNTTKSYLMTTLNSLFSNAGDENDLEDILIVIFLADTEKSAREKVKHELLSNFDKYFKMNLIHVISAPSSFYPRLKGLPRTLGDSQERMYWRSKQTMDYVFMFQYSHGLAEYYMQLEDDVIAEPDYMPQIRSLIDYKHNSKWAALRFNVFGFIGKLFRDDDLPNIARFMETFYNDIPCDWLLLSYTNLYGKIDFEMDAACRKEIFHHTGDQSSSLGT